MHEIQKAHKTCKNLDKRYTIKQKKYTNMHNTLHKHIQYIQMHKAYTNIHKNIQTHKRQTQNMHKDTKYTLNTKHKHTLYIQDI